MTYARPSDIMINRTDKSFALIRFTVRERDRHHRQISKDKIYKLQRS